MSNDTYKPSARDCIIARFGRNSARNLRLHCNACLDNHPLTDASAVYGDLFVAEPCEIDRAWDADCCDVCGVTMLALSQSAQAEHDEQQARWARQPINHVVEYGIPGDIRCRIY